MERVDQEGKGATKGKLCRDLVCKRTWLWIVGKVHKLSRVIKSDRSAGFHGKEQLEHLKDRASEGSSSLFSKQTFFKTL